jgi:hypothetical protein
MKEKAYLGWRHHGTKRREKRRKERAQHLYFRKKFSTWIASLLKSITKNSTYAPNSEGYPILRGRFVEK